LRFADCPCGKMTGLADNITKVDLGDFSASAYLWFLK
jgi:hypothetical protein